MNCIMDNLYAGSWMDAQRQMGRVNAVLDLRSEADVKTEYALYASFNVEYRWHPCDDGCEVSPEYLTQAVEWIHSRLSQGKTVLVHCFAGISRTATVICAYLVAYHGMTPEMALNYGVSRREVFDPHPALWRSLLKYTASLGRQTELNRRRGIRTATAIGQLEEGLDSGFDHPLFICRKSVGRT